ncbi:NAD(P)-dependent alcohol dehydrogenase [Pseudonocardia acidicola]|uniref:NAD(P)-dependent alcohol dehydrogenase n=1 Tax=Pseudonocardia acidicola TaxID=2724939 RepID=A0ABX1S3V8_9PSEU|nr:NAD(P)-dependent alcohol dehydrogenase [Pseudonocardia acidicola]NMH96279.1 NAD(P)-dependent alcohol dehydrogenase [Pseudonocardia acidicola]
MRVAVLRGIGEMVLEERPVPRPGPGEVLVRITAVGMCGSDVHYYEHGRLGDFVVEQPLVLGHEPAGEVVGLGSGVTRVGLGRRVSIEPGRPCFTCTQCLAGRHNLCPDMRFFATPPVDGALCEYVAVHEAFAHPVPDALSDDAAALLEPLSVGVWAARKGGVAPGSRVLVNGAGPIGLVAVQVAIACGAAEVVVADVNPVRLVLAGRLGATGSIDVTATPVGQTGYQPDVLLECSGNPQATRAALGGVAPGGRAVLVGSGSDDIPLPLSALQRREIELVGTFRYANTWPTAIALASSGRIDLDALVTGHFGLDDAELALTAAARDAGAVKAVVRP